MADEADLDGGEKKTLGPIPVVVDCTCKVYLTTTFGVMNVEVRKGDKVSSLEKDRR